MTPAENIRKQRQLNLSSEASPPIPLSEETPLTAEYRRLHDEANQALTKWNAVDRDEHGIPFHQAHADELSVYRTSLIDAACKIFNSDEYRREVSIARTKQRKEEEAANKATYQKEVELSQRLAMNIYSDICTSKLVGSSDAAAILTAAILRHAGHRRGP